MSWIVALESEGRQSDSLREVLSDDGWLVDAFPTYEKVVAAIAERSPQLVIVDLEIEGAERLLAEQSRKVGGPGTLVLVAAGTPAVDSAESADEQLRRPFTDQDLRLAVRTLATAGRAPKTPPIAAEGEQLTSQDLFGDLLAEVEGEPLEAPPASPPPAPAATPPTALDRELSGLLSTSAPKPRPATRRSEPGVDDLLSKTLSGLEIGESTKKPAPKKPAKAPAVASEAARRRGRELDLSELDSLARRPASDKTPSQPDSFATQKLQIPGAAPAATPREFGQYTLLERIALGGMAEVWKARMKGVEGFQKTVAIKKILPHLTDSTDFVTMFVDEAKLAAQLNHTNIIHIYDLGKIVDDYYIAMEYVDGKDLRTILNTAREKGSPLPLPLALTVASRLAGALDHAHRQKDFEGRPLGLVHRDVSPQNVLISFDGDIKLCDFGIVKAVSKASKTQMGALKGKLQYMSPEQAWGRTVDARSDIFSLGSLLFEMLTGRRLFAGESEMSVLDAVREGRVQAPRDLDPRIPLEVNAAVLKALAREPQDRYESAGDFQREIDGILASLKPSPSQRDLALYVQRLFDIGARPAKATLAVAETVPMPAGTAPPSASGDLVAAPTDAAEPLAPVSGVSDAALESAPVGRNPLLWIGIAAAVVLGVVGITLFRGSGVEAPAAVPAPAPQAAASPVGQPSTPATTAEDGAPDVETVPPSADEREASTAPEPAAPTPATPAPPTQTAETRTDAATPPQTSPPGDAPTPTRNDPQPQPSRSEPARTAGSAPALPPPAVAISDAPSAAVQTAAGEVAASTPPAVTPAPPTPAPTRPATRTTATPTPAPAPKGPSVREGDLVTTGPSVSPPVLVSVDKPEYPPIARRMRVEGTVNLSVLVDENGQVLDVRLESGVSQNVGINEAALAAARTARFRPATKEGVRVKIWHRLTIPFKL